MNTLLLILISTFNFVSADTRTATFKSLYFGPDETQLSGLVIHKKNLILNGDSPKNMSLYRVQIAEKNFQLSEYLKYSDYAGFNYYLRFQHKLVNDQGINLNPRFDTEGVAVCDNTFYMANEQTRHLFQFKDKKFHAYIIKVQDINKWYPDKINLNAGFEGITVDCEKQIAYIAQERSPRGIFVYDLKNSKILDFFDPLAKERSNATFSGMTWEAGHLYVLDRENAHVHKINPATKKIIMSVDISKLDRGMGHKDLYDTGEPYGLMEGLAMDEEFIYTVMDNNENPISKKAKKIYGGNKNESVLLIFHRPKDF